MLLGFSGKVENAISIGVTLFPTNVLCKISPGKVPTETCFACQQNVISITRIPYHPTIHLVSAALFLVTLALMSLLLFTKSTLPKELRSGRKKIRNRIYRTCGVAILLWLAACGIYFWKFNTEGSPFILVMETLALIAFGTSWLIKGDALLQD